MTDWIIAALIVIASLAFTLWAFRDIGRPFTFNTTVLVDDSRDDDDDFEPPGVPPAETTADLWMPGVLDDRDDECR